MSVTATEVDPFLDDQFAPLDTRTGPQHAADTNPPLVPQPSLDEVYPARPIAAQRVPVADPDDQPETFEVEGGTVTISHDAKGWHGTLSLEDGGGDEVFHGKTQKELMTRVLAGKVKATAQIRKLNRKLKLGTTVQTEPVVHSEPTFESKVLSANDIFEIKTAMESNPDQAADLRFQKKYGMTEAQLVERVLNTERKAKKGEEAYEELTIEGVSKEFLENNKEKYYPYAENGDAVMSWLIKNKLRRTRTNADTFGTVSSELLAKGLYTVENLEEALEDLEDSGLLLPPPQPEAELETPAPEPAPAPARPVQPAVSPRIAAQRRQPRGGLGIRPSSVSATPPEEPRAPSADELENMSSKEISELLAATRKHYRETRR